jgi:hypothetical protein
MAARERRHMWAGRHGKLRAPILMTAIELKGMCLALRGESLAEDDTGCPAPKLKARISRSGRGRLALDACSLPVTPGFRVSRHGIGYRDARKIGAGVACSHRLVVRTRGT